MKSPYNFFMTWLFILHFPCKIINQIKKTRVGGIYKSNCNCNLHQQRRAWFGVEVKSAAVVRRRRRMEGRRRGGWCGRRIVATRRGTSGATVSNGFRLNSTTSNDDSVVKKLFGREICSKPHRAFAATTASHRFRTMRLTQQYDTHDPKGPSSPSPLLPFLMKRTKVVEIVAAKDIVFALAHSGLCAAFSRGEGYPSIHHCCLCGFVCELKFPIITLLLIVFIYGLKP